MAPTRRVLKQATATVQLDAVAANYKRILAELDGIPAAGVVKANGYGLGADQVAGALWASGCRRFFVARIEEGIALRATMPEAEINVFDGVLPGTEAEFIEHDLVPILNSLDQVERWSAAAVRGQSSLPAGLHIDTGMRRLGFPADECQAILDRPELLDRFLIRHVLSHLASADMADDQQSPGQLHEFVQIRNRLSMGTASLANSAGIFRGAEYHFELARPGISVYGGSPLPESGMANPMRQALLLEAPIAQVRRALPGETVGYGATHRVEQPTLVATIPVGYADGFLRSSSSSGSAAVAGQQVPIIGRVSMDLITIDVTSIDEALIYPGAPVELIGPNRPIDDVAAKAGSIPHEFLTNLSNRFRLEYRSL